MKNFKAGFSLVELMVVVAIIGILATIAVPNFTKFQAKSKQSNAKTELAGIYTAEKAFFSEFSTYNSALNHIGYLPDGIVIAGCDGSGAPPTNYIASAGNGGSNCGTIAKGITRYYRTGFGAAGAQCGAATTCGGFTVPAATAIISYDLNVPSPTAPALAATSLTAADTFIAEANGRVRDSQTVDQWVIDENKGLQNKTPGI